MPGTPSENKLSQANEKNIPVIDEDELFRMISIRPTYGISPILLYSMRYIY